MKVLSISNLFFKLPDDFNGGLSEALRMLADYHDEKNNVESCTLHRKFKDDEYKCIWEFFLKSIEEDKRYVAQTSISEYDENTNEMKIIERL